MSTMTSVEQVIIPEGYKQTEVGVIPEDWLLSTVGENTFWMSGGTPSRSNDEFWSGKIPWISGSTLKHAEISTSDQFLTAEGVEAGSKMAPLNSTLLLVRGSALHNQIRAGLVVAPVCFNQDVKALVPNASVEPKYLTLYLLGMNNKLLKLVSSAGNSAGVLDTELVQNFKFLKPPIKEQTAIANALSNVDNLIASLETLIAKKSAIKTAAMQQLLTGKKRLPGFEGQGAMKGDKRGAQEGEKQDSDQLAGSASTNQATLTKAAQAKTSQINNSLTKSTGQTAPRPGYKQSELGEIPEDWEVKPLGDLLSFKNGLNKAKEYFGYGLPIVNYMDVYSNPGIASTDIKGMVDVTKEEVAAYGVKKGDVFFTRTSETVDEIGLSTVLLDELDSGVFSGFILRARDKSDQLSLLFKKYCFSPYYIRKQIGSTSSYTTRALTNGSLLSNVELIFPSCKKEQIAIANVLSDMDTELDGLQQRLSKTQKIKQGMMQELLTGKTRLTKGKEAKV